MAGYQSNFPYISPMQIGVLFMGPPYKTPHPPPPGWVYDGFVITNQTGVGNYYDTAVYTVLGEGGWWAPPVPSLATAHMHWVETRSVPASYEQLPDEYGWQPTNLAEPPWTYARDNGLLVSWVEEIKYKPYGVTLRYYAQKKHYWHYEG